MPAPAHAPPALALVEVLDRDGRVRRSVHVHAWPATIGRAIDNDIVIDDPHVAPHHARIEPDADGALALQALPSVNGLRIGRRRLADGERAPLPRGDAPWSLGGMRLRVRLADDALAPERPLVDEPSHLGTVVLALLLWAWILGEHWLRIDPGSKPAEWLQPLLLAPAALAGWCAAWALASKLFQLRFEFWPHLALAVRYLLALQVTTFALDWVGAVSGIALLSRLDGAAAAAIVAALVVAHARLVLPERRRGTVVAAVACYVVGVALVVGLNLQRNDRVFDELYMAQLPPPALRLDAGVPIAQFVHDSERLQAPLDAAARRAASDERDGADDAGDDESSLAPRSASDRMPRE